MPSAFSEKDCNVGAVSSVASDATGGTSVTVILRSRGVMVLAMAELAKTRRIPTRVLHTGGKVFCIWFFGLQPLCSAFKMDLYIYGTIGSARLSSFENQGNTLVASGDQLGSVLSYGKIQDPHIVAHTDKQLVTGSGVPFVNSSIHTGSD